jgi:hypothetical protein
MKDANSFTVNSRLSRRTKLLQVEVLLAPAVGWVLNSVVPE